MTNEEAIAESRRIEESIEARILAGEIPPRPSGPEHAEWFAKHLACSAPTHRYFVRERGHVLCRECLAYAVVSPPEITHDAHGLVVRQTVILNKPLDFIPIDVKVTNDAPKRAPRRLR